MARCRVEIGKERAGLLGEALVHAESGWHMMSRPELRQVSRGLGALVCIGASVVLVAVPASPAA